MADYKQTEVQGTQWVRAKRVIVDNPYMQQPTATFIEEMIINTANGILNVPYGHVTVPIDVNTGVIDLVNPQTGELLGTQVSHMELYVIVHSFYMQQAKLRDTPVYEYPAPPEEPPV